MHGCVTLKASLLTEKRITYKGKFANFHYKTDLCNGYVYYYVVSFGRSVPEEIVYLNLE